VRINGRIKFGIGCSFKIQLETYLQIDHMDIFRDLRRDFRVVFSRIVRYIDSKFPQAGF
jgi:hypothetical protein